MTLYRLVRDLPPMEAPVLIVALDGWVDAAGAATAAAQHLARAGDLLATFDADAVIDYRARRPTLDIVDGSLEGIVWPELAVRHVRARAGAVKQRDLLVLSGPEPDFRWREFGASILDLCLRAGVTQMVSLGAVPLAVPHTRPTRIVMTATPRTLLGPDDPRPESPLRVPAAAVSAIEKIVTAGGVPAVGFWAHTPHYLSSFVQASVALLERLARHLGVAIDVGELRAEVPAERARLDSIIAERQEVKEYVERLEALVGEQPATIERIPTGEEIATEIERYLRERPDA